MRLIDADETLNNIIERHCMECILRKGMKNGKMRVLYDIGEAPCRACLIDDMKSMIDDAPTVDAVPVIRCKDCKYLRLTGTIWRCQNRSVMMLCEMDDFCSRAERKEE